MKHEEIKRYMNAASLPIEVGCTVMYGHKRYTVKDITNNMATIEIEPGADLRVPLNQLVRVPEII